MNKRLVSAIFVALLAVIGGTTSTAVAQDKSLNEARAAFDNGQSLFQEGQYLEAAVQFQTAYEARPFAQFLFNIGACYEKAKDYNKALEHYNKYLETTPSDDDIKQTNKRINALKKAIDEAAADPDKAAEAVQALEDIAIRGLVVIESEPQGASIYLDTRKSKPLSKTPWNGTLTGEHIILLERKGYKPVEKSIRPDPNKLLVLFWGLAEEDYLGWIDVTSNIPGADIYIDDKSVGAKAQTPWSGNLDPGKHTVWVTKEGYDEYETTVEVIAGETHKVAATLAGTEVGYLNVRGRGVEKVKVYVDGKILCKRGPCLKPLAPGKHKVSIRRSDYKSYNQTIEIQSKTEVTMRAKLAEEPSRTDAIVSYIAAAVFLGGGYYAGTRAKDIKDELDAEIADGINPPDNKDKRFDTRKYYAYGSTAAYALGATTLGLGIYYTFRDKGRPSTGSTDIRAISFEPTLAPGYAGLGLSASF